jgi:ubiquitin-small subunit ribosomal protein S27Ae
MAKAKGAKKDSKGKQAKPKKEGAKLSALYEISGESITRKNRTCPKCGPGMFLGKHKTREVCGKCGYVEYHSKPQAAEAEKEQAAES